MIEVLKEDRWRRRNLLINIYGDGRDRQKLKDLIADLELRSIVLHEAIVKVGEEQKISNIWQDNHAIIAPSRMEGFSNMVLNGMISGRVPIVTDIGGHSEVIKDGLSGFLAANPTIAELDDVLERAWQQRTDWRIIGERAREAALNYLPEDPVEDAANKLRGVFSL